VYIKIETQTKSLLKCHHDIKLFQITKLRKEYETREVKMKTSLIWMIYLIAPICQEVDCSQFLIYICIRPGTFSFLAHMRWMVEDYFSKTDIGPLPCLSGDESAIW
jgi:hypothetical protein